MMGSMWIRGRLALGLALSCSALSGCALLDGSSRLEEALEHLPADATSLVFVDLTAGGEPGSWPEVAKVPLELADVEWGVSATAPSGTVQVWKLSDDVDFDALPDRLPGGFAVVADEQVVVTGADLAGLQRVATDRADSLADEGSFAGLLDRAGQQDGLAYAAMDLKACFRTEIEIALFLPVAAPAQIVRLGDQPGWAPAETTDRLDRTELVDAYLQRSGAFACPEPSEPWSPFSDVTPGTRLTPGA